MWIDFHSFISSFVSNKYRVLQDQDFWLISFVRLFIGFCNFKNN